MRSFLIRDILSGSAINAAGANPAAAASEPMPSHQEILAAAAAQSLAATQARLLAKWAEHQQQQQLQASKYFEQLQQQHNHLNLNLITSAHATNITSPQIHQHHQHQQQQQQQQQYQQLLNSLTLNQHLKTQSHSHNSSSSNNNNNNVSTTSNTVSTEDERDDEERELEPDDEADDEDNEDEEILVDADEPATPGDRKSALALSGGHQEQPGGSNQEKLTDEARQQMEAAQCSQLNSPLDALFQMTSSTFDTLKRGEKRKERASDNTSNFATKQNPKKKRKSRTAFTNSQIYELERRFRMQKYLSPTDRDEIAMTLNLSNAQVITWFQNRRAKMKRDVEEQRRDIETASLLNLHKTFLESFQALSQMKTNMNSKQD